MQINFQKILSTTGMIGHLSHTSATYFYLDVV